MKIKISYKNITNSMEVGSYDIRDTEEFICESYDIYKKTIIISLNTENKIIVPIKNVLKMEIS